MSIFSLGQTSGRRVEGEADSCSNALTMISNHFRKTQAKQIGKLFKLQSEPEDQCALNASLGLDLICRQCPGRVLAENKSIICFHFLKLVG